MRQVPHYLFIGNGRVSRHFQHYFSMLQLPFDVWSRQLSFDVLAQYKKKASHSLILIPDRAIESFLSTHVFNTTTVHFSGSLVSDHAHGVHPLQTFGEQLYDFTTYQQIPFVIDDNAPPFTTLLPGVPNQHARLSSQLKAKYHALCVASGNFSCLLWQTFFKKLQNELHLPSEFAQPFLQQQTKNLLSDYKNALTGPLSRHDTTTIEKNLAALHNDPLQKLYLAFLKYYEEVSA